MRTVASSASSRACQSWSGRSPAWPIHPHHDHAASSGTRGRENRAGMPRPVRGGPPGLRSYLGPGLIPGGWGGGEQHRRHLMPGGLLGMGDTGWRCRRRRVPAGHCGERSPGQETKRPAPPAITASIRSMGRPERVAVRPQPANRPRGSRRSYCRPPCHPVLPSAPRLGLPGGCEPEAMLPGNWATSAPRNHKSPDGLPGCGAVVLARNDVQTSPWISATSPRRSPCAGRPGITGILPLCGSPRRARGAQAAALFPQS